MNRELQLGFSCGVLNVFPFHKLEQFKTENPDIQIHWEEMDNQGVIEKVFQQILDVGFVIGSIGREGLYAREVFQRGMDALVYEGHPLYDREELSIDDLRDQPLITLNEKFYCYHSFVGRCKDFGFAPLIHIKTMESQLIYRFCREKMGIGIDTNIHKNDIRMDGIHRIVLKDAIPWRIFIVCREDHKKEQVISKLLDLF